MILPRAYDASRAAEHHVAKHQRRPSLRHDLGRRARVRMLLNFDDLVEERMKRRLGVGDMKAKRLEEQLIAFHHQVGARIVRSFGAAVLKSQ